MYNVEDLSKQECDLLFALQYSKKQLLTPGTDANPLPEEAVAIATFERLRGCVPTVLMQSTKQRQLFVVAIAVNALRSLITPVEVSQWQNNNHSA